MAAEFYRDIVDEKWDVPFVNFGYSDLIEMGLKYKLTDPDWKDVLYFWRGHQRKTDECRMLYGLWRARDRFPRDDQATKEDASELLHSICESICDEYEMRNL